MIIKLVMNINGIFKNAPIGSKKYLLLNKVEGDRARESSKIIANNIFDANIDVDAIIAMSLRQGSLCFNWVIK